MVASTNFQSFLFSAILYSKNVPRHPTIPIFSVDQLKEIKYTKNKLNYTIYLQKQVMMHSAKVEPENKNNLNIICDKINLLEQFV